jgi:hypothetical protein
LLGSATPTGTLNLMSVMRLPLRTSIATKGREEITNEYP